MRRVRSVSPVRPGNRRISRLLRHKKWSGVVDKGQESAEDETSAPKRVQDCLNSRAGWCPAAPGPPACAPRVRRTAPGRKALLSSSGRDQGQQPHQQSSMGIAEGEYGGLRSERASRMGRGGEWPVQADRRCRGPHSEIQEICGRVGRHVWRTPFNNIPSSSRDLLALANSQGGVL